MKHKLSVIVFFGISILLLVGTVGIISVQAQSRSLPEIVEDLHTRIDILERQSLSQCRVGIQLHSNSAIDGEIVWSEWTSGGEVMSSGTSGWAEAHRGTNGGGKYAAEAFLQCN